MKLTEAERMLPYVLCELKIRGPELRFRQLANAVRPRMTHLLTETDLRPYDSGQIPWEVKLSRFKDELRKRRLIDPRTSRGVYRITRKGSQEVEDWLAALTAATGPDA